MNEYGLNEELLRGLQIVAKVLRLYHRHEAVGLEHIPEKGAAVLALNHSLATYDICLLFDAIFEMRHRVCRPLVDRLFYKVPYLGDLVQSIGAREGNHDNAKCILKEGHILAVAPGGMREALRPSTEKYQIRWRRRKGFVRLAIENQVPLILATCPKADDLYDVYPSLLTSTIYKRFRVPLFFASGFGYSFLPKPVKLVHYLSEPIYPPSLPKSPDKLESAVEEMHEHVVRKMLDLTAVAVERETTH